MGQGGTWHGVAGHGTAWQGKTWLGLVGMGVVRQGKVWALDPYPHVGVGSLP